MTFFHFVQAEIPHRTYLEQKKSLTPLIYIIFIKHMHINFNYLRSNKQINKFIYQLNGCRINFWRIYKGEHELKNSSTQIHRKVSIKI